MRKTVDKKLYRIIDANFNRAKEGLRVCEDIFRFLKNNKNIAAQYKKIRHQLTEAISKLKIEQIIKARDIVADVGKDSLPKELSRTSIEDILYANSQRVKESVRVLEEFTKLINIEVSLDLKKLRYEVYELERKVVSCLRRTSK